MKFMLTCEEASLLLSEKMDVSLSPIKRLLLQTHLLMCRKCTAVKEQMLALRKIFQGLDDASANEEIKLPDESRERIKQTLREQ